MLGEREYRLIYKFQNELLKLYLDRSSDELFKYGILRLLDQVLGYKKAILGFLGNINERTLSPNVSANGVDMGFAQEFLRLLWARDSPCRLDSDTWIFSREADYKRRRLYKTLLKPNGLTDCAIFFLHLPDCRNYIVYLTIFLESGTFTNEQLEIIDTVSEPISLAEDNYLRLWNLQNTMKLLQSSTNFFPLGIMIVENLDNVTYANDLAKAYLKELGYPDPRFYSAFYLNELYRHFQYDVLNFGSSKPIRVGRFLFNIQTLSNPGKALANMDRMIEDGRSRRDGRSGEINYREMTTCVYIVSDKNYKANMNISRTTMDKLGFTNRERQVVEGIVSGLSNQEICEQMVISINTVKNHISSAFRKAGVRSRTELLDKLYNLERES